MNTTIILMIAICLGGCAELTPRERHVIEWTTGALIVGAAIAHEQASGAPIVHDKRVTTPPCQVDPQICR